MAEMYKVIIGRQTTPEKTLEEVGNYLLKLADLGFINIGLEQVEENKEKENGRKK